MEDFDMHKVVYNTCYGGFSLSMSAIEWLNAHCEDPELKQLIKDNLEDKSKLHLVYEIVDFFDNKRHHKDLVAVVEALGDRANGECAALDIATISGRQYRIEEYDGAEEVVTPEYSDLIVID
jgi:hypothetical protein